MKNFLGTAVLIALLAACGQGTQGGGDTGGTTAQQPQSGAASDVVSPASPVPVENATTPVPAAPPKAGGGGAGSPASAGEPAGTDTTTLVKRIFPDAAQVVPKSLGLDGHAGEDIGGKLGQPLEGHDLQSPALVATSADGRSLGAAWQTDAHVTGGNATVIVGMGLDSKIRGVVVTGSPDERLESADFLGQFTGKTADQVADPAAVQPVGGAPETDAREIAASIRRAALVLKEGLIQPTEHTH